MEDRSGLTEGGEVSTFKEKNYLVALSVNRGLDVLVA